MRLIFTALSVFALASEVAAETVSRTVEARATGAEVHWVPEFLELSSQSPNSLRVINGSARPQCFAIQNLIEPFRLNPGEMRVVRIEAFQHGRFTLGCPDGTARGGDVIFKE